LISVAVQPAIHSNQSETPKIALPIFGRGVERSLSGAFSARPVFQLPALQSELDSRETGVVLSVARSQLYAAKTGA
jgi:hypothetical protein